MSPLERQMIRKLNDNLDFIRRLAYYMKIYVHLFGPVLRIFTDKVHSFYIFKATGGHIARLGKK
jgi:hypothetical protein